MDHLLPCHRDASPLKIFKKIHKICALKSVIPDTKLDELNDDCLAHIFEMLENIYDLYNIVCTSSRFQNVLPLISNRKFSLTVTNVTAINLKHFLQTIGIQIRSLYVPISERNQSSVDIIEFLEMVQNYCPKLKSLTMKKWSHLNFNRFKPLLKRLKTLSLDECDYTEINDLLNRRFVIEPSSWVEQPFPLSSSLQTSSGMSDLISLTTLKLHRCKGFRPDSFQEFLQQNGNLIELSLFALVDFKNSDADEYFFNGIAQYLQDIETMSIDVNTTSHIQFIAKLPKLRCLRLFDYSVYNDRIVDCLLRKLGDIKNIEELDLYHCNLGMHSYRVISQLHKLHTLKLRKNFWVTDQHLQTLNLMPSLKTVCCFDNIILSDEGLMSLVRMSPNLTKLDCSWCFQVTNRTIHDIQHLFCQESSRPKLDILVGGRSKITESVLNDISRDRISIIFDPNMPITCIIQNSFCLNCTSKATME
ncbi:uncharacterized protein LOC116339245 [Contarinia nasturtii]|uniref:uncharacterized protein LOC116339245 n=1 Tax=Contarinia nasturtii TaxID=265458 RepID=UPI0012D3803B|nr:uncharacterized protein LOC116339245 [Contarinia nasturtii]XP_031620877.1 uncharacterized protein LOC116339245 [Contarinia nasturtii]XP_031620878.1 uncharacterized protein LOC116339245 [Contarinia nasturtii]XP_031620879.1 uncharacterized protein LOC116339245 [Contarinia nasturtii]XP_031620881.1 uncharacterized protein LOC116339245 [Contarinia nasturtii]